MSLPGLNRWYRFIKSHDRAELKAILHPDVVFESPVVHTPQRGADITYKYLASAIKVLNGESFEMLYEAGHSQGRKDNFTLPKASLAGHALETGELQWSNNVEKDRRWHRHPKADEKRGYRSLASMPIVVGDDPVAVLNVVSSAKEAFLRSDLLYIELLGGFIGLAWALEDDAASEHRLASSQEASASRRKGA